MPELDRDFWNNRYQEGTTGWDIGYASPAILSYFEKSQNKSLRILIPGAGKAYEASALYNMGFHAVHVLDIADLALENLKNRCPEFPEDQMHCADFFEFNAQFDVIVEQTFFCALPKWRRREYVKKCHELLVEDGRLVGLLFDVPLNEDRPPFGGNVAEYRRLFDPFFIIEKMEKCISSIPQRMGNEVFILLKRRGEQGMK